MAAATVLVVDDEPTVLDVFTRTLIASGYDVLAAAGPYQALEIVRTHSPIAAVLSDVTMPGMRGTDLVREITQVRPTTSCVLLSGGAVDPAEIPDGVPLLRKPLPLRDLVAAPRAAIERSAELQQEARRLISESEEVRRKSAEDVRQSRLNRERCNPKQETQRRSYALPPQLHATMRGFAVIKAAMRRNRACDVKFAAFSLFVRRTVEEDLPREIDSLASRRTWSCSYRQNKGTLSKNRREHEFRGLRDDEVALIEGIVRDAFDGFQGVPTA